MQFAPLTQSRGRAGGPSFGRGASTPAPIRGWNVRDAISNMPVEFAPILDNWFPGTSQLRVRNGYTDHVSSFGTPVETLMVYADGDSQAMFAASGGSIYDVSSSGSPGSAVVSGLNSSRFQHVNMGTSGGRFLIAVSGEDVIQYYDGTNWGTITGGTTPAITGVTTSDLVHVNVFKRRLFFVENDSLSFWYLPVDSIGGAATEFDLSSHCRLGGFLMAMGTWTRDGGEGIDDFAVFFTSRGEVVIYQGTDPGDADAWSLVGVFPVGAPVGRRCMMKVGPELVMITEDGFVPLSNALAAARTNAAVALSDNIRNAVNDAVRLHGSNFGWEGVLYPRGGYVLFNIPTSENETAHQYVANATTGAWCRFTGQNANCWAVYNDELYFGGVDAVRKADDGLSDNGADIETDVQQAFSYLGARGVKKRFTMLRPMLEAGTGLSVALTLNIDFDSAEPLNSPLYSAIDILATEDDDVLITEDSQELIVEELVIFKDWQSVDGIGYAAAIRMKTASAGFEIAWNATDWVWESGGMV